MDEPLDCRGGEPAPGHLALLKFEPFGGPHEGFRADAEPDVEDRPDLCSVRPGEVEVDRVPGVADLAEPGGGRGLHVQVVRTRHPAGTSAAPVRRRVRTRVVGEVADAVGVQLRRELPAAAAEQQPTPERVLVVVPAEGIQLDRLQRQHQRLLRIRTAQNRRLYLPPVNLH